MNKCLLLIAVLAYSLTASGQTQTLFGNLDATGAFGSPILEIGRINGQVGTDIGGGGALVLEYLFLGGYGMGTDYPDFTITDGPDAGDYNLKFGHGGIWLGFVPNSYKVIHPYSSVKIGWGKARLRQDGEDQFRDRLFTLIPELGFEVNVTDFFRLSFAGSYRWVTGIDALPGLNNNDFSSPMGIITFRFGGFDDGHFSWDVD